MIHLEGVICYDICNYYTLSDVLMTMTYLNLPGKEQLQIVLKNQDSKGFKIKGFK